MHRSIAIFVTLGSFAFAHDLYLMPAQTRVPVGEPAVIAAHVGDSFPASESPLDPTRIVNASAFTSFRIFGMATWGTTAPITTPGSHVIGIGTKPRLLELEAAKWEAYLKDEGLDSILAWRKQNGQSAKQGREMYSKFAKTLIVVGGQASDGYKAVAGFPIEFVLEADPATLKPGATLPVQVLWKGKPAPGLQVELAAAPTKGGTKIAGRTDAEGRLQVKLGQAGRYRVHTVAMERSTNPAEADWESVWASFTFELVQ